jgi:adenylate kinase family enzyme
MTTQQPSFELSPIKDVQIIKGVVFPSHLSFRQLLITGPPGSGKTTMIVKLGGWSEEGYIDLSLNKWWTAQSLSVRPREIHLGFPFVGHENALAVFEKEWLEASEKPALDLERIKIPPDKKFFFSVNWRRRFVFEFMLPPADVLLERRLRRSKKRTHYVDENLQLETIEAQIRVYQEAALFLHQHGLEVYIREDVHKAPMYITRPEGLHYG